MRFQSRNNSVCSASFLCYCAKAKGKVAVNCSFHPNVRHGYCIISSLEKCPCSRLYFLAQELGFNSDLKHSRRASLYGCFLFLFSRKKESQTSERPIYSQVPGLFSSECIEITRDTFYIQFISEKLTKGLSTGHAYLVSAPQGKVGLELGINKVGLELGINKVVEARGCYEFGGENK